MKIYDRYKSIKEILDSRLFYVFSGIVVLFGILVYKFYQLQIVEHEVHAKEVVRGTQKIQDTEAVRGQIFDKYGRPLAINKPLYVLSIDQQVKLSKTELNEVLLKLCELLEKNGDVYKDDVPISIQAPFHFTENDSAVKQFVNSIPYNGVEHRDAILEFTADELIAYLRSDEVFQISDDYTPEEARKIIALRHQMYQLAYQKFKSVTVAEDISQETIAIIEEYKDMYPGVMVEVESYRYYPFGEVFGNILGYTREITQSQYEHYGELGYDMNDVVGQMGIEQTMEEELRGVEGEELIEVDNLGRKVHLIDSEQAKNGNNIFLTIDATLQSEVYEAVENRVAEALISRIEGTVPRVERVTPREVLISMVESNQIVFKDMAYASMDSMQYQVYQRVIKWYEDHRDKVVDQVKVSEMTIKTFFIMLLEQNDSLITNRELLLVLEEQGRIELSEQLIKQLWAGTHPSIQTILVDALETGRLKPSQMAVEPFSAAAVVVDIHSGEVLSMVGYPSYDNNALTTHFNTYYSMLQDGIDERNVLWNRALMTAKAPGSPYKMLTSLIGLNEGVINEHTVISDTGPYPKAGNPQPRCWFFTNNGYGHGASDIHRALEVSCNYYFYEVAYLLSEKYGTPYDAIDIFTEYTQKFGLDQNTGIELPEASPQVSSPEKLVESEVTKALNVIRNLTEKGQEILNEIVVKQLEEGIYPTNNGNQTSFEGRVTYSLQQELKHDIDEVFREGFEKYFNAINESMISDFKKMLDQDVNAYAEALTENVMSEKENGLKNQTKESVKEFLIGHISETTSKYIQEAVDKVGKRYVKSLYYDALEDMTNNPTVHKYSTDEVVVIEEVLDQIDKDALQVTDWLVETIEESMVQGLVDYLFENANIVWNNGINVRTAIGQGNSAYTPTQIARYIAALANGKSVYDLKIIDGITDQKEGQGYVPLDDKLLKPLDINQQSLDIVYEGMYDAVNGNEGTARHAFKDSNVVVGGKTGTAQEFGTEHSWFTGFAPYDNPEVAVVTVMYDAYGLGKYNYSLASDIFNIIFGEKEVGEEATMNTTFVE